MKIRRTSTLAEDEGVVFVTYVPHFPIQVLGRRDPRTHELCVGTVFDTSPDFGKTFKELSDQFEPVTGAEAERLLAQVYADITMRRTATWEGKL